MKIVMALGALAVIAAPLPALAGEGPRPQSVKTRDLDLRTERGVERLNTRLAATAARVCSVYAVSGTALATTAERRCRQEALSRTSERVAAVVARANRTAVAAAPAADTRVRGGVIN